MIKNRYLLCLFVLLTLINTSIRAQTPADSARKVVTELFMHMKTADTAAMRQLFAPTAVMQTIANDRSGNTRVLTEPVDSFLYSIAQPHDQPYDERVSFDVVKIDGDLAAVWAPYRFYLGEKFLHCGVDSFQLVRLRGRWLIQYIIDTRRSKPCL